MPKSSPTAVPINRKSKSEKALRTRALEKEYTTQNPRPSRPVQNRKRIRNSSAVTAIVGTGGSPCSNVFRSIQPTWRNYIYYANRSAIAGDDKMKAFIKHFEALPAKDRDTIMPESVCDLAGVTPSDLVAAVSKEVFSLHVQGESTITASMQHPRMIESIASFGTGSVTAFKDRELFMRATGTLPDKHGASIIINNTPSVANLNMASPLDANGFRAMDRRIIDMSKLLDEPTEENVLTVPVSDKDREVVFENSD